MKLGAALTVSETVVLRVRPPEVPVMVKVNVPVAVVPVVEIVRVEFPAPVTEAGLKLAVAPDGRPETESATELLKPFRAPTVAVNEVPAPSETVWLAGEAETVKSRTTSVALAVRVTEPSLPVMVSA